jgi:putative integral membrane protein (TIGR02587 family)
MPAGLRLHQRGAWGVELVDLVRAASGGLLFGIPLLYTMEMWWVGNHTTPAQTLLVLGLIFVPVFVLNRTSGFRSTKDVRMADAVKDTVEAVALGIVLVAAVLFLLREIRPDTPLQIALAKIVYEAVPFCLGIGVAAHFLRRGRTDGDDDENGESADDEETRMSSTAADVGASVIGSVFVAFNIAPTDEIPMIHAQLSAPWLVAFMGASLLASYGIVFVAGFTDQDRRHMHEGALQHPVTETVVSYLIALGCAALMLWLFQRIDGPWDETLGKVIVLGLPAAIGGAAGRLAI